VEIAEDTVKVNSDTVQKLQAGNSFSQILPNVSIILAFALVFFLIAAYRFGRNDSLKTVTSKHWI
jgi:ABC-2 type transport system permease protein